MNEQEIRTHAKRIRENIAAGRTTLDRAITRLQKMALSGVIENDEYGMLVDLITRPNFPKPDNQ